MRHTRRAAALLILAGALLAGGCGSDDGDSDKSSSSEKASSSSDVVETIDVSLKEFSLNPPDLTVDKAGKVAFKVTNDGTFPHALEIEGDDVEAKTEHLDPGDSETLEVDLKDGSYEVYCPVGDHRSKGMVGTLVVGDAAASATSTDDESEDADATATTGTTETDEHDESKDESSDDDDGGGSGSSGSGY
jgi:uncharacterized cupredoxin-like copper-binding protein